MDTSIMLVAFFALTVFWFMWRGMKGNIDHISEEKIHDFLSNRLDGRELRHTREHLLKCDECKELLDKMSTYSQKPKPERLLKRRF